MPSRESNSYVDGKHYSITRLGKMLLIHSMKKIIVGEPDIVKVDLDVTLENNATFLYKSVGFKHVREYSMYTWVNE